MKTCYFTFSLLILTLIFSCTGEKNRLMKLKVMEENYPRAIFFRASEFTLQHKNYEKWEDSFDDLMGFIGQAGPYDRLDHTPGELDQNPEYFTRFKKDNPDQMVLMHLAGDAADPRSLPIDYFAGHWLYYQGAKIISDVPEKAGPTEIQVSDARLFHLNIGMTNDRAEDIGLCMLDANGKPNWNEAEQVQLISVDTILNTITVDRCQYGTAPHAFPAGQAYAASHVTNGPWMKRTNLAWAYNYSTLCPVDKEGKVCSDKIVEYLARELGPGGMVYNLDGLAFDVVWQKPRCLPSQALGRLPDLDGDGKGDDFATDSTFDIGVIEFFRKLREALGEERIITSDHQDLANQRAFGILNGMESEGFPIGSDPYMKDWSGGLNRLLFWDQNCRLPAFSFINATRYWKGVDMSAITINYPRLEMAASTMTGAAIDMALPPGFIKKDYKSMFELFFPEA